MTSEPPAGSSRHRRVVRTLRPVVRPVVLILAGVLAMTAGGGLASPFRSNPPTPPGSAIVGGLPIGVSDHYFALVGGRRWFRVYRPETLPTNRAVPLVLVLHAATGTPRAAENHYGWDAVADRAGFVVVYPQGVDGSWDATPGRCCGAAGARGVDDVGFLTAAIATISATVPVDPARIYATGALEGGIMAYRLACLSSMLAAVGPVGGTQMGPCPHPAPTSLIHIHGGADTRVRFDGRPGEGANHIEGAPVDAVVAAWRAVDHCPGASTSVVGPVHTTSAECPDGRAVTLIEVDGAGHQWPGAVPYDGAGTPSIPADPPSTALQATETLWAFFAGHPRR